MDFKGVEIIEVVVIIVCLVFILSSMYNYLTIRSRFSLIRLLFTMLIWGGILTLLLFPDTSFVLAQFVGLKSNINALVFLGFVTVFFMIFRLYNSTEKNEQELSRFIRTEALRTFKEKYLNP